MPTKKTTKRDVINWLTERLEEIRGECMDAEEDENDYLLHKAWDKETVLEDVIKNISNIF